MKKILLILPVLLISLCALAAIDPQSEKQAEEFYREGKYNEAAEIYRKLRAGVAGAGHLGVAFRDFS